MERVEYLRNRFSQEALAIKFGMLLEQFAEGSATISYTALESDCVTNDQNQSIVQGGVLVGILADFAAVYAAMSAIPGGHTPLIFGSFSLYRPTFAGDRVSALATVSNISRRVISVSVRIIGEDKKLKCEGTYHFSNPVKN